MLGLWVKSSLIKDLSLANISIRLIQCFILLDSIEMILKILLKKSCIYLFCEQLNDDEVKLAVAPCGSSEKNCWGWGRCPLEGKCLTKSVVYQATVTRHDNHMQETYVGLTENTFKIRYNGHNSNFKNKTQKNATALSQYIWTLKDNSVLYSIKWIVLAKCKPYSPACKRCNLCLMEKFFIICKPKLSSLNHRNELVSACRHRKKHLLCNNWTILDP